MKKENCQRCKKDKESIWRNKETNELICQTCYSYLFSYFYLTTKVSGYLDSLKRKFPELIVPSKLKTVNNVYLNGICKSAPAKFKSWTTLNEQREQEIEELSIRIQQEKDLNKQLYLQEKLKRLNRLKDLEFRGNEIYVGTAKMFDLIKQNNDYFLEIVMPYAHEGVRFKLNVGKREDYTENTNHNKFKVLDELIASKEYLAYFPKLLRRIDKKTKEKSYSLMLPKRFASSSLEKNKEIEEHYVKNPNIPIVCLDFGIKRPITLAVFKKGKFQQTRTFGNGEFFHHITRSKDKAKKMQKVFARRYLHKTRVVTKEGTEKLLVKGKWRRNQARKKFQKKQAKLLQNYIKNYSQNLTTDLMRFVEKEYPKAIIVLQDTSYIKKVTYSGGYNQVLHRWNIEMQKEILNYKAKIRDCQVYFVPYKLLANLTFYKDMKPIEHKDKEVKTLTIKLRHAYDPAQYWQDRVKMAEQRLQTAEKRYAVKKSEKWKKLTPLFKKNLTYAQKMSISYLNTETFKNITLNPKRNLNAHYDFYMNNCNVLNKCFHSLIHEINENK